MADQHTEAGEHGTDTGSAEAHDARPTRAELAAKDREAFLAGEGDDDGADDSAGKPKPKAPAAVEVDELDDELEASLDEDDLDDEDDGAEDGPDDDDDDDEEAEAEPDDVDADAAGDELAARASADPELKKRLDAVRKTEQRGRAALARERQEFERERAAWNAQTKTIAEAQQRFDRLASRARYDSYSVLRELGVSDEDMEYHGRQLYGRSKAANVKPEHRDAADKAMREREHADELAAIRKEHEELKQKLTEQQQVAAADAQIETMLSRAARFAKATEAAPLTKQYLTSNPKAARAALERTAAELARRTGELPNAKAVIAAHEKARRRDLRDLGIKLDTPAEKAAAGKIDPKTAAKPKTITVPPKPAPKSDKPTGEKAERVNGVGIKLPSKEDLLSEDWSDLS